MYEIVLETLYIARSDSVVRSVHMFFITVGNSRTHIADFYLQRPSVAYTFIGTRNDCFRKSRREGTRFICTETRTLRVNPGCCSGNVERTADMRLLCCSYSMTRVS